MEDKKKRGRKKKDTPIATGSRKRKRGRKPKCEITSIQDIREKLNNSDDKVIFSGSSENVDKELEQIQVPFGNLNITVHSAKPIDKQELRSMFKKPETVVKCTPTMPEKKYVIEANTDVSESEAEDTKVCRKCQRKNVITQKKQKNHKLLFHFTSQLSKEWPMETDILCWWCCHSFNTIPIPAVTNYDYKRNRYQVKGIFCSWNCAASYTTDLGKSIFPLYKLKKEWTQDNSTIKKAPHKTVLKAFGGPMTIEEFRNPVCKNREMYISTNKIEYTDTTVIETYTEKKKRKSKKRSI